MSILKKYIYVIPIIGLIILDQLLKINTPKDMQLIDGILKLTYVENTGGAFGILSSNTITLIIANIIVIIAVTRYMIVQKDKMNNISKTAGVLIIAGGISNLIDRIIRGYVVDYIDITQIIKFPIFNLADVMLTIGWIFFIIGIIVFMIQNKEK